MCVCRRSVGSTGVVVYQRRSETSRTLIEQDVRRGGCIHSTKEGPSSVQHHTDEITTERDPSQLGERKGNEISRRGLRIPGPEVENLDKKSTESDRDFAEGTWRDERPSQDFLVRVSPLM